MGVRNKIIKALGYIGIYFLTLLESYLISIVGVGAIMSIICMVWSFFAPLSQTISSQYGAIMLVSAVAPAIAVFIYIVVKVNAKH